MCKARSTARITFCLTLNLLAAGVGGGSADGLADVVVVAWCRLVMPGATNPRIRQDSRGSQGYQHRAHPMLANRLTGHRIADRATQLTVARHRGQRVTPQTICQSMSWRTKTCVPHTASASP
jgi:hypothetical protein